ncbi:glycosyltransferase family 4 protein [Bacillus infantis]|uniref:glycosyltransferase family 4 protein n=1 Tax=Bacillus infantis TaxID=324767 RepID=UPI003CFB17A3
MKILITSFYPLPYPGGIWSFVSKLKQRLESMGHIITILSLNQDTLNYRILGRPEELTEKHVSGGLHEKVKKAYPGYQTGSYIFQTEVSRGFLESAALHYGLAGYDIIYAQDAMSAGVIGKIKPPGVPLVMSAHGYLSGEIFYNLKSLRPGAADLELRQSDVYNYFHKLERLGYNSSDLIHSQSEWMKGLIINGCQVPADKVLLFPYGMETDSFLREIQGSGKLNKKGKKIILFTGRLVTLKGLHTLLPALGKLYKERQDWECWILGEGGIRAELEQACRNFGIAGSVLFFGTVENVLPYLNSADIFVLPGLQDTQPHSVMEAQLAGLPAIVSDAAGLPEMVHNQVNGMIFPAGNSEALLMQLRSLIQNDGKRAVMGQNALQWARTRWSYDALVTNILSMFNRAIAMKKTQ